MRLGVSAGSTYALYEHFFGGQIDDFRYYQNTALNSTQISYLYNEGVGSERTYGENDITIPTAELTQNTITPPTAEYSGVTAKARTQTIVILT